MSLIEDADTRLRNAEAELYTLQKLEKEQPRKNPLTVAKRKRKLSDAETEECNALSNRRKAVIDELCS